MIWHWVHACGQGMLTGLLVTLAVVFVVSVAALILSGDFFDE